MFAATDHKQLRVLRPAHKDLPGVRLDLGRPTELHYGYQPASTARTQNDEEAFESVHDHTHPEAAERLAAQAIPKELAIMLGQAQILCTW